MRKLLFCFSVLSVFSPACLSAQSLVGIWVSTEPIVVMLKFSLTFSENEYQIDCSLGHTIGTYYCTPDKIYFNPTKIRMNGGNIGKHDTWDYSFIDKDSFYLSSGIIRVRLVRRGVVQIAPAAPSNTHHR